MEQLTVGSLFSGIGGLDLGLERAGMRVIWHVENDPFCQAVLARQRPGVAIYGDIGDVDPGRLPRPDLLAGGFPCQPVSEAGYHGGADDERWLWPEFFRVLRHLAPRYVLVENVTGLLFAGRGMGSVLGDLADIGYDAEWTSLSACAVGAPHMRFRVFIVAYPASKRLERPRFPTYAGPPLMAGERRGESLGGRWAAEPKPHGVAYGTPDRNHRLRAVGNSVVPQVAEWIGRQIIKDAESMTELPPPEFYGKPPGAVGYHTAAIDAATER